MLMTREAGYRVISKRQCQMARESADRLGWRGLEKTGRSARDRAAAAV